ncbi:T9SS type A sorting domain-containing protein [Bacteroidales bacterium OttesenSCG-928-M11]|nr:T9SS type A sorting domain-containing protein [Bacteroidales bacterium OttesenSCG-928-M11]
MKKTVLLLLTFLTYTGICFSQDLVFKQNGTVIKDGSTITISDPEVLAKGMIIPHIIVENTTNENITATLILSAVSAPKNGMLSYCGWGTDICKIIGFGMAEARTTSVLANSTEDPAVDVLATDPTNVDVLAEYLLSYNGVQQKIYLHVTSTPSSLDQVNSINTELYQTDGFTFLNYDFGTTNTRYLNIYDITGKKVVELLLSNDKGTIQLPTPYKGIYIYSIVESGRIITSKKYTVTR